ncbi:hypothetical protein QNH39_18660 [Neobacillus novalis]|uniref:Uncharacterized protein n=1 Tax=Neobacillus novalis TaxID=220687 RepID=A0AA95S7D5_9BACI|nr:hypothetical protein [Neobacillus novalis]WHY84660.1 hypothetical protein QNH39_18660 [Neobacillus novalis]
MNNDKKLQMRKNMENVIIAFLYIGWLLMPILCVIFCLNLVSILKKVKNEEKTTVNTAWLTISFTLIVWSIAMIASAGVY